MSNSVKPVNEGSGRSLLQLREVRTDIVTSHGTVRAMNGMNLAVDRGEIVGLVGESGSGKTMTGMSIVGLLPPGGHVVGGEILFGGQDLAAVSKSEMRRIRGSEIGFVFQDPMTSLNPTMTIGRQIAEAVRTHRSMPWSGAYERASEVLALVGMPQPAERLGDYPHQLSGGLRQRVVIAIALACEPKLLIADEPTTALDVTIQDQILTLLDDLRTRLDMGVLLITHDLGVVADRTDRVVVMYAGEVVESADTTTLFSSMRHRYTQALLEAIPSRKTDSSRPLYTIPGIPPRLTEPATACQFAPRCRHATEVCRTQRPVMTPESTDHIYACFHPVQELAEARMGAGVGVDTVSSERRPSGAEPLVALRNIVKEFPIRKGVLQRQVGSVKAVSDVSLDVIRGEVLGLVGESGCGKTTLGRMMVALEGVTSGTISFDGVDVNSMSEVQLRPLRREMQLMFQDPYSSLDPRMRVGALVKEPLQAQRIGSRSERDTRVAELLGLVGLPTDAAKRYPHEFSGGQRQRIGLARALALNPRLLVADEPVSALDVSVQAQVLNLMRSLRAELGLTYVFISHDLSVIRYVADRIAVMYLGKLVEMGPSWEVFDTPAHPYTRGLLDAVPEPIPGREKVDIAVQGELPSAVHPPSGCRFRTRCPRAQDICATTEPVLSDFSATGHQAACHFPLQRPVSGPMSEGISSISPGAE